ncbi:hypothetical protein GCM10009069_10580 [Algimonas arctica]|uniref:Flagellar hook-length control protein-like C-terminal domain-containing protein n=1 Tax=Algimonas arctica TaxID=1479486 RepID=A0A8J3G1S5_9PROT|nr:flagellar hook-length control protein FliK [Algimonas arctica]GHA89388.1 hypothetical protein GCM10009069_10580 [Algimonas arctica]
MSALPNVLMTQTNPRAASPAAAGLKLTADRNSDYQGRSFEETLSDQTDVNPHASGQTTEPEIGLTTHRDIQLNDNDVARKLNVPQLGETEGSVDRAGLMPAGNLSSIGLDVSIPVEDTPIHIPMTDSVPVPTAQTLPLADTPMADTPTILPITHIATLTNADAILPTYVVAGDPISAALPQANVPEGLPNLAPLPTLTAVGTASMLPISAGNGAAPPTTAPASTLTPTPVALVNPVPTEGELLPTSIAEAGDNTPTPEFDAIEFDASDRPRLSERAAETAEYRALAKPTVGASDLAKLADAPTQSTPLFANSDMPAPLKSVPVIATAPTLTPLSGMSDRLAATILQTTNAQPTVTMDKIPQAVVAIALSAKSATLQIDPPELGRIQLDYQFDSQGRTVVTLTPESDAARAALMDRMAIITAALEQGTNSPVDVKLGDARDFGSEFGQASQEGDNTGSDPQDSSNGSASTTTQTDDLQRFVRAPMGEAERLHILV